MSARTGGGSVGDVGEAVLPGLVARGVVEHADLAVDPDALDRPGPWVVVATFEGRVDAWRFAHAQLRAPGGPAARVGAAGEWRGPARGAWTTSLDRAAYVAAVGRVRDAVREGDVYQANLCRVLAAPLPSVQGAEPDAAALAARLAAGNPAPYGGYLHVPAGAVGHDGVPVPAAWVVSASPELFCSVRDGVLTSGPIKGTATAAEGLTDKDRAENVMIADLVRNDLQQVSATGSVEVTDLLATEHHPGLVHLVTRVAGRLRPGVTWPEILAATHPPASVSGAPKLAALDLIRTLEPVPRGPYCGAFGWVDAARGRAELAVAIRTFWWADGVLRFGTGAGITWGSDPEAEWAETELKARRLVGLASDGGGSGGGAGGVSARVASPPTPG